MMLVARMMLVALIVCWLAPVLAAPRAQPVIVEVEHGGTIDWTRGLVIAMGAAPGDIRAPSPDLARVGAERRARVQAQARLLIAARALRVADAENALVGAHADADAGVAERLAAAVARALDLTVDYGSDGSVVLTAGLPLEAVRQAVRPRAAVDAIALDPSGQPTAQEPASDAAQKTAQKPARKAAQKPAHKTARITAVIVDARGVLDAPVLGLGLVAGAHEYAGPTVFHGAVGAAAADARRGPRFVRTRATAMRDGRLVVDMPARDLASANEAHALVIVILRRP